MTNIEQQRLDAIRQHFPNGPRRPRSGTRQRRPDRGIVRCDVCGDRLAVELIAYGRHLLCGTTANETPDWSATAGQPNS